MSDEKNKTFTIREVRLLSKDDPCGELKTVLICQKGTDPWELMQYALEFSELPFWKNMVKLFRSYVLGKEESFKFKDDHHIFGKYIPPKTLDDEEWLFPREVTLDEFEELKKDPRFR